MPTLYYRVEAPGVNILKTVTDEAIAGLLDELDLTTMFKNAVYPMSSFMASSQYSDGSGNPTMVKNRCDIDVSYVMDKSQVPWPTDSPYTTTAYGIRTTNKGNHTPIFIDEKAGVLIEHHTVACALDMKFTMTFITFDEACKAFDTIQSKYKGSLIQTPFDLSFSYPVSVGMFKFLIAAYKAKLDYKNKTFINYIDDMKKTQISFDVRKSQLTDPDADKSLMIRCQQLNCLAQLTMEQKEPESTRVDELPDIYTISFDLVLQFGRPSLVAVHTPVSIDNTALPYGLFENNLINFHSSPQVSGVYQDLMINEFMKRSYGNYGNAAQIVRVPEYDDWFHVDKQYQFYEYRPFFIQHFTLDGPTTVINLKELESLSLHPIVLDILTKMKNQVFEYGGLFNIGVYANTLRLGQEVVELDGDLNLTITSNRPDKVYHLMLSESTSIFKMSTDWDDLLLKYRYFFPLTIERNLQDLVKKRYFYVDPDNQFLNLIAQLERGGKLKALLKKMIELKEDGSEIYGYTQNSSQLAEYLSYTQSYRQNYTLPTGDDVISAQIREYYKTKVSVNGRSLFVAFVEQCLIEGYVTLDTIPDQYIQPNQSMYPYYSGQGGYYGFNTPFRIANFTVDPQHRPK